MPFIPHTENDIEHMLNTIGVDSIEQLFDEIPSALRAQPLTSVDTGLSEMACTRLMHNKARLDDDVLNFLGAGAYEHHIPAAVWSVATRGEFMTAYTPYQAEASQGTLQVIYEYQTMMTRLLGMEVSNASMYDGATALGEACLMAVRIHKKSTTILCAGSLHPFYQQTLTTILNLQNIKIEFWPINPKTGLLDFKHAKTFEKNQYAGVVIVQPNFLGNLEAANDLTNFAHAHNALAIAVVNPTTLAMLNEPGEWGEQGVDIACGEGQPLGVYLNSGGPYFGFLCCRKQFVRQMPGRIVGRTIDENNAIGYTLTLQAREQHIRRAKATSNICTNQGLAVTAATIYMSILGSEGLAQVARASYDNTHHLADQLTPLPGVSLYFKNTPYFHEVALKLPVKAAALIEALSAQRINAGFDLTQFDSNFENGLLICATETKTPKDLTHFVESFKTCLENLV